MFRDKRQRNNFQDSLKVKKYLDFSHSPLTSTRNKNPLMSSSGLSTSPRSDKIMQNYLMRSIDKPSAEKLKNPK